MRVFLVLAALLALQSLASLRDGYRFLNLVRKSRRRPPGHYVPPVALIVPCKGGDADFERHVECFRTQNYPDYRLIFVVASNRDPAHKVLAALLKQRSEGYPGLRKTMLVVAGRSEERGEKVNNLLRALSVVEPAVEVLVFADADAQAGRDWLRSLVAPLADPKLTVSTGYRWYLPGRSFASQLRAAWDTSVATLFGEHNGNFAWGGSMAIRRAEFERLRVSERYWARTVSDDYGLTRAVREARGWIRFEPRCLLASREECTLRDFLRWANRQIIITRVYATRLWCLGLAAHLLYCGTFLVGVAVVITSGSTGERIAVVAVLLAILLLGLTKARLRTRVAREVFPEEEQTLARYGARYWQLAPLVPWIMLLNFVTAGLTRRIEWRGVRYELQSADNVRVLGRDS